MLVRYLVIFLLSLLLLTSSFSISKYLDSLIATGNYNQSQLQQALSLKLMSAQYAALHSYPPYSVAWLSLAKIIARTDKDIAWQLTQHYHETSSDRNYRYWFKQSLALGSTQALLEKSQQYAKQGDYLRFKQIALQVESLDSLLLQIHYSITFEQQQDLQNVIAKLKSTFAEHPKVTAMFNQLETFNILPQTTNINNEQRRYNYNDNDNDNDKCPYAIQFFASELNHLKNLSTRLKQVRANPFFNKHMCILKPQYIAKSILNCDNKANERIQCNVEFLIKQPVQNNVRYIGVIGDKGVANVNHGMVFLDDFDNALVIEHELLHFLGFIDEYPLHKHHGVCQADKTQALANNIISVKQSVFASEYAARQAILPILPWYFAIAATTPITHKTAQGFELGTPRDFNDDVGLFLANTCNHQNIKTFKPLKQVSQLQYYEELLPPMYQTILKVQAQRFMMPSYEYNIALWLIERGRYREAKHWFERASRKENNLERQRDIALGNY